MNIKIPYHGVRIVLCSGFIFIGSFDLIAHDTNTTHPRLTISAGDLIESSDSGVGMYYELYKRSADADKLNDDSKEFPYLWGQDPPCVNSCVNSGDTILNYDILKLWQD